MTRTLQTAVGLTLLALAPVRTAAQVASSLDEVVRAGWLTQMEAVMRPGRLPHGDRSEHKAGFGQIRVLRFRDDSGAFLLLGGVRF